MSWLNLIDFLMDSVIGKPTWILLKNVPDWRWMLDREDSPWYNSAKLYRQDQTRTWAPVLKRISTDLKSKVNP